MELIDYETDYPITWTDQDKFNYWFKRANDLYATQYDPYQDRDELKWCINAMYKYISEYTYYRAKMDIEKNDMLKLTDVMFLTYNPKKDIPLKKGLQAVNTFLAKQKIKNYIYVVEQRGLTEEDMGDYHIHILHTHTYDRASHYKRETQSTFNKTCLVAKWQCLNFQPCYSDQDVKKRLNYILGQKQDHDGLNKTQKQEIDKLYRKKYFLKDYYTNNLSHWEQFQ